MSLTIDHARDVLQSRAWTTPDSYVGFNPIGDYVLLTVNRDSEALERSNWETVQKELGEALGAYDDDAAAYTFCANHWAVGWVEYLLIRQDAPDAVLIIAAEILAALADYPIFDEEHYSELEYTETCRYWDSLRMRERIDYCKRAGISIFAARRECPSEVYDLIR